MSFAVVRGGRNVLVIRLDDESSMRIPRSWTDADGNRAGLGEPEHVFTADAVRALGTLVASLVRRLLPGGAQVSSRTERAAEATNGGNK